MGIVGRRPLLCAQDPQVFCAPSLFSLLKGFPVRQKKSLRASFSSVWVLQLRGGISFVRGSCVGACFGAPVIAMA
jgi:hypothetical protein